MNPTDILDDLTLVPLPEWWENPWVWVAGAVGAFAVAWGLRRWLRRSRPAVAAPEAPPPPVFSAAEALQQLEALRGRLPGLSHHDFAIEASDILRRFIEGRHRLPILFQTTGEFLQAASGRPELSAARRELLARFLGGCDQGKFAAQPATAAEMTETLGIAVRFVNDAGDAATGKGTTT